MVLAREVWLGVCSTCRGRWVNLWLDGRVDGVDVVGVSEQGR